MLTEATWLLRVGRRSQGCGEATLLTLRVRPGGLAAGWVAELLSLIRPPGRCSDRGSGRSGAVPRGHSDRRAARIAFLTRWARACLSEAEAGEALAEVVEVAASIAAAAATTTSEEEVAAVSEAAAAVSEAAAAAEEDLDEGVAAAASTKARTKDLQNK